MTRRKPCDTSLSFHSIQIDSSLQRLHRRVATQPSSGFDQEFQFVDGLQSKAQRKRTRAFVTKQHYRRKRYEELESATLTECTLSISGATGSASKSSHVPGNGIRVPKDEERELVETQIILSSHQLRTSFIDTLGRGRSDPFDSYPVPATRDVHELVDHYYFVIPSLVHRHWHRAVRKPRSCWDLFNLYRKHEIPFLCMLHHAALHLATLKGRKESLQAIEFKQRSLEAVNRSLQVLQGPCDDWTTMGVGLLANAERVWGDREIARLHWGALKRLLLERGGFPALRDNLPYHTKIVWSFIALSWPTMDGNPAYLDEASESVSISTATTSLLSGSAYERSCDELVEFVNRRKAQALKALPSTAAQHKAVKDHPLRTKSFQAGSKLSIALDNFETGYNDFDKRRAVDNCRMASLIHLNLVLAELGDFSSQTETYLATLQQILEDDDDDSDLSAEHLLWTLLSLSNGQGHFERVWKMSRLVGVVKRTSSSMWSTIENVLRTFLRLPANASDLGLVLEEWSHERFLMEAKSPVQNLAQPVGWPSEASLEAGVNQTLCSTHCNICPLKPATY
ncbi:hypothetical protein PV08_10249 [Exophiala spinifera]|uniref:Transcription factor domain-containing protein n=1 Tax=Exophiala spinifera TaxID=91928 RepID=A0A0D2AWZ8_9EURO|nr:uncharacterized protein PV08_10249 [Exophiala spinifera]KIW10950.1 hypothetical protein PV08_10249 [Exophiala spinifera]